LLKQNAFDVFKGTKATEEDKWFGTKLNLRAKDRKAADRGLYREGEVLVHSIKNDGRLAEVVFPGDDFTTRIDLANTYDADILDLQVEDKKPLTQTQPEQVKDEKPKLGQYQSKDQSQFANHADW